MADRVDETDHPSEPGPSNHPTSESTEDPGKVLYDDKHCTLTTTELIVKFFWFPTGKSHHISLKEIKSIKTGKEAGNTWLAYKSWGSSDLVVWWACDMHRAIDRSEHLHAHSVIVATGDRQWKKGFTVERPEDFLKVAEHLVPDARK